MPAAISYEAERGCGYRKVGGIYLCCDGDGSPCGRLPLELRVCPTCSGGIHPCRGWTWIDPKPLFEAHRCKSFECNSCPVGDEHLSRIDRCGLIWVGHGHYGTPEEFQTEARRMGISRRIKAVPQAFVAGKTWVMLGHRRCFTDQCPDCQGSGEVQDDIVESIKMECPDCKGSGKTYRPGIFSMFLPSRVEKVVDEETSEEDIEKLNRRGIDAVIVKPQVGQITLV